MKLKTIILLVLTLSLNNISYAGEKGAWDASTKGDNVEAFEQWKLLAEQGDAKAQYNLGLIYALGKGVPKDLAQAIYWFEEAAEQDHIDALMKLGFVYYNGKSDIDKDLRKSAGWYIKAAEKGDAQAQNKLASMYQAGEGVLKDYKKAIFWYEKSATQGNGDAQNSLGMAYIVGRIVKKDVEKGKYWVNKAYEGGDAKVSKNAKLIWDAFKLWKY